MLVSPFARGFKTKNKTAWFSYCCFFFSLHLTIHIRKQKNKKHQYFYKAFQINFIDSKTLWSIIFLISPLCGYSEFCDKGIKLN